MRIASVTALVAVSSVASAQSVLYDNGGFITHPGQGAGGADVSQVDSSFFGLGNVVAWQSPGDIYRGAEDFEVPAGETWTLDLIRVFAYNSKPAGGSVPPSAFTAINMNIWDGDPRDAGSDIVASSTTLGETGWTGVYRVEPGMLMQDTMPVYTAEAVFDQEELQEGEYWIDFQIRGGFAVTPYVMDGLLNDHGNAMVLFSVTVGWFETMYDGRGIAYPFIIEGEGGGDCYADCDGTGDLDFFDFLCFQNLFAAGDPEADCDDSGTLDFFDFLCFQNAFAAGCP